MDYDISDISRVRVRYVWASDLRGGAQSKTPRARIPWWDAREYRGESRHCTVECGLRRRPLVHAAPSPVSFELFTYLGAVKVCFIRLPGGIASNLPKDGMLP